MSDLGLSYDRETVARELREYASFDGRGGASMRSRVLRQAAQMIESGAQETAPISQAPNSCSDPLLERCGLAVQMVTGVPLAVVVAGRGNKDVQLARRLLAHLLCVEFELTIGDVAQRVGVERSSIADFTRNIADWAEEDEDAEALDRLGRACRELVQAAEWLKDLPPLRVWPNRKTDYAEAA